MSDLIERDKVINILEDMDVSIIPYAHARKYAQITIDHIRKELGDIPSARPKEGKWLIEKTIYDNYNYRCNNCDWYETHAYPDNETHNFCPHCGADMRGDNDGKDIQSADEQ